MNKVELMGRLTRDIEIRYTNATNTMVGNFTLAVRRQRKQEETDFINCIAYGKIAEIMSKYCTKGDQVAIVGRIQTRSWTNNQGENRYATEIITDEFYFVENKKKEAGDVQINEIDIDENDLPF